MPPPEPEPEPEGNPEHGPKWSRLVGLRDFVTAELRICLADSVLDRDQTECSALGCDETKNLVAGEGFLFLRWQLDCAE